MWNEVSSVLTIGLAVCACFPPRSTRWNLSSALPYLLSTYRYNELRVDAEGHLSASVESSEHSSPLSGFLKLSSAHLKFSPLSDHNL